MNNKWRLLLVGYFWFWAEKDDYAAVGRSYLVKWSYQKIRYWSRSRKMALAKTAQRTITNNRVNARTRTRTSSRINVVHLSRGLVYLSCHLAAKLSSF